MQPFGACEPDAGDRHGVGSGMILRRTVLIVAILVLIRAPEARGQSDNKFALGANVSLRDSTDTTTRGRDGVGLLCRFGQKRHGWKWDWALNWIVADINQPVAGSFVRLGELHVRPIMAGYGYDYRRGRQLYFGSVVGGHAFASMALAPVAVDAYHDRLGARSVSHETSNTLVVRPEIGVWHDLNDKIGLNVSASFLIARPRITVRTTLGADERTVHADMFQLRVGIVYSIF